MPGQLHEYGVDRAVLHRVSNGNKAVGSYTLGPFYNEGFTKMRIIAVSGTMAATSTLDIKLQMRDLSTNTFFDMLDHNAAVVAFEQWTDDDDVRKILEIGPSLVNFPMATGGTDAYTGVRTYGAAGFVNKAYNLYLPAEMQLIATVGTAVAQFGVTVEMYP